MNVSHNKYALETGFPDSDKRVELPSYPYLPGLSPRHADRWFDDLKASVTQDIRPMDLSETRAFIAGRLFFDAGYYWECHEVLDPVWKQTIDPSPERDIVLALIQLANARLKLRMNRPRAAWRLCDMVEAHLWRCPKDRAVLGLKLPDLQAELRQTRSDAKKAM